MMTKFFSSFIIFFLLLVFAPNLIFAQEYSDSFDSYNDGVSQETFDQIMDSLISEYNDSQSGSSGTETFSSFDTVSDNNTGTSFDAVVDQFDQSLTGLTGSETAIGPTNQNQSFTLDNGVTQSYETEDPGGSGLDPLATAPVLNASTSCIGYQTVVDLHWTSTNLTVAQGGWVRAWYILRSDLSSPLAIKWHTIYDARDITALSDTIYFYRVFGASSEGGSFAKRTPLSNTMAVRTPDCSIRGFVYNDLDGSRSVSSADQGISGERVQVIRLAYEASPAYEEVTSTDENGNPTGYAQYPAVIVPETVMGFADTDANGYYSIPNIPPGNYIVQHARDPLWSGWSRVTPRDVAITAFSNPIISFGLSGPPQSPPPSSPTPVPIPAPTVSLWLNNQPAGDIPLSVDQAVPVTLRWEATNADSCTATSNPSQSYWTGSKNTSSGSQVVDTTTEGVYLFRLSCTNTTDTRELSIQLQVNKIKPFIKTTGGDVHTNESINISP